MRPRAAVRDESGPPPERLRLCYRCRRHWGKGSHWCIGWAPGNHDCQCPCRGRNA